MSLTEKVAYIKGVMDGKEFNTETAEGKIISLMLDLLEDVAQDVVSLEEENETLRAYIEELDEDLGYLEDVVYDDLDDDCDFCDCSDEFECEGNCDECECDDDCDECERGGAYDFFKVVCPSCNEQVYLDNSIDPSNVICPACHNQFSVLENN